MNFLKHILFLLLLSLVVNSYAQGALYGPIKWVTQDSLKTCVFKDEGSAKEWGVNLKVNENDIKIAFTEACSGKYCLFVEIYMKDNVFWHLIAETDRRVYPEPGRKLTPYVDYEQKKIIFNPVVDGSICDFPFEALKISDESRKCANLIEHMDELGKDESPILNETEGAYLNCTFKEERGNSNFIGKKVAFLTGSSGTTKSDKTDYFKLDNYSNEEGLCISNNGENLYIFNATQKEKSGGYDAAIVYWSKFILPMQNIFPRRTVSSLSKCFIKCLKSTEFYVVYPSKEETWGTNGGQTYCKEDTNNFTFTG